MNDTPTAAAPLTPGDADIAQAMYNLEAFREPLNIVATANGHVTEGLLTGVFVADLEMVIAAARAGLAATALVVALADRVRALETAVKRCYEDGVHVDLEREFLDDDDQEPTYEAFAIGLGEWQMLHGLAQKIAK